VGGTDNHEINFSRSDINLTNDMLLLLLSDCNFGITSLDFS